MRTHPATRTRTESSTGFQPVPPLIVYHEYTGRAVEGKFSLDKHFAYGYHAHMDKVF
mgnify:FL=1